MEQTAEEFFHNFRQELLSGAEAHGRFQLDEFMETVADELVETGFTEGFELCHYRPPQGGMRVDGYWFNDEGNLDLFVADFDFRTELVSLTRTELEAAFKRLSKFFEASIDRDLAVDLEVTSPVYGLAKQIADRRGGISSLNLILLSERTLSGTVQSLPEGEVAGIPASYHVWDILRLHRQHSSRSHKEPLDLDFVQMFGKGIASLPAHLGSDAYQSFLMVMPADFLATLYGKFGARLLEQNVRTFLQARGSVNNGIRATILNEPEMFFAYNNGVTATAQRIETETTNSGLVITRVGKVLRRTSLDELPQLWNILRGDMSFVGPRAWADYELECYKDWHYRRLEVPPGLTGLAQINGRSALARIEELHPDLVSLDIEMPEMDGVEVLEALKARKKGVGGGCRKNAGCSGGGDGCG